MVAWPGRLTGLRARMALILGAVLVVPFAYATYEATSAYLEARSRLVASLQQTARLIAEQQAEYFDKVLIMLNRLAEHPAVLGEGGQACEAVLQRELDQEPRYRHFGHFAIVGPSGQVRCTTNARLSNLDLSDRPWFQATRQRMAFTISDVVVSRGLGIRTLVAVYPLKTAAGAFAGAAAVSLDLDDLNAQLAAPLADDAIAFLVDSRGQPVSRDIQALDGSDPRLPDRDLVEAMMGTAEAAPATVRAQDLQAGDLAFTARPIRNTPLFVVVGMPDLRGWTWLEQDLIEQVLATLLMLAIALVAIWLATDLLVTRHVAALARTARAYARGNLTAVPEIPGAPSELRELSLALGRMSADVSERQQALEDALAHKELLLREIHHRVKNNLQIVVSLLNLRTQAIHAPKVKRAMLEAQASIKALALVHRSLYEHDEGEHVHLDSLIPSLCALLTETIPSARGRVELHVDVAPLRISVDRSIPLALLIAECVTNSLKHAFPGGRTGRIDVSITPDGGRIVLEVRDDGAGFSPEQAAKAAARPHPATGSRDAGIGLILIEMLARQLGGELAIEATSGTSVRLTFDP